MIFESLCSGREDFFIREWVFCRDLYSVKNLTECKWKVVSTSTENPQNFPHFDEIYKITVFKRKTSSIHQKFCSMPSRNNLNTWVDLMKSSFFIRRVVRVHPLGGFDKIIKFVSFEIPWKKFTWPCHFVV
jgi:hypothetical protein